jgi:hypothetical protein
MVGLESLRRDPARSEVLADHSPRDLDRDPVERGRVEWLAVDRGGDFEKKRVLQPARQPRGDGEQDLQLRASVRAIIAGRSGSP